MKRKVARPEKILNPRAMAIGRQMPSGRLHVRRIVWGRLLAREERRPHEIIREVRIVLA